jgi:hypothetical protein
MQTSNQRIDFQGEIHTFSMAFKTMTARVYTGFIYYQDFLYPGKVAQFLFYTVFVRSHG